MKAEQLRARLAELASVDLALPGAGETKLRFARLCAIAREDVSLAKLAEAHWDAVAILREAGSRPMTGAVYAVWASEVAGSGLLIDDKGDGTFALNGTKPFASGGALVDRALVTTGAPRFQLLDIDLRAHSARIHFDHGRWSTDAFRDTQTGSVAFDAVPFNETSFVGEPRWYVERAGMWHGACGIAACWTGAAEGLVDWARRSSRRDAHTLAHMAAMDAACWANQALLAGAALEIDAAPVDSEAAMVRALRLRHSVEAACSDILWRFARAYGPHPLAFDAEASRRYAELELWLRQCHGERDLQLLGEKLTAASAQ